MLTGIIDSGQKIVTNGLVLHLDAAQLRSYPGSGTTWTDLSGNGNNGTLTNGPTFNSANGGSIVFDEVNDYVSFVGINLSTTHSSFVWLLPEPVNNAYFFAGVIGDGSSNTAPLFVAGPNNTSITDFGYTMGAGGVSIGGLTLTNTWNCLCSTRSGTAVKLYLNGSLLHTGTLPSNTSFTLLRIAHRNGIFYYDGNISTVLVYNNVLSDSQVLQNYNATKSRFGL